MIEDRAGHAEAEVEIGDEKDDEVGVATATVPEGEARSAEVMSEDGTIAGTETEKGDEVGARTDEIETTTEKGVVEVARGSEVKIAMIRGEETAKNRREAGRKKGRAADNGRFITLDFVNTNWRLCRTRGYVYNCMHLGLLGDGFYTRLLAYDMCGTVGNLPWLGHEHVFQLFIHFTMNIRKTRVSRISIVSFGFLSTSKHRITSKGVSKLSAFKAFLFSLYLFSNLYTFASVEIIYLILVSYRRLHFD